MPADPTPSPPLATQGPDAGVDAAPPPIPDMPPPPYHRDPPYPKPYSNGVCPTLIGGPTIATSVNTNFPSGKDTRAFRLIVPTSYDGTTPFPLFFGWHWLNATSASLIEQGELELAAETMKFIAVIPDHVTNADGSKKFEFDWPFAEVWGQEAELTFFDDLLTCVNQQYKIDRRRVHALGASSGALWTAYISTTNRADYIASVVSASGGLGEEAGVWQMNYVAQPNKFPALVIWGGDLDWFVLNFADASKRYRDALVADNHFVTTCTHMSGHGMPPMDPPPWNPTKLAVLWQFLLDHPYGLQPGTSPYQKTGLLPGTPTWCTIVTP